MYNNLTISLGGKEIKSQTDTEAEKRWCLKFGPTLLIKKGSNQSGKNCQLQEVSGQSAGIEDL